MPTPNTLRQNVREKTEKEINRRLERAKVTDEELDTARAEWTLSDYNSFVGDCTKSDRDMARCGAIWNLLKEAGDAPTGGDDDSADDSGVDDDRRLPAGPDPETVEQLEEEFRAADNVFLVTTPGCPSCAQAKEALSDWIDEGVIRVENVQESDKAADIVLETNLDALPALVIEHDGRFAAV